MVKNPPANAGDTGSTPDGGSLEKEMATHSSILAWDFPRIEEPNTVDGAEKSWAWLVTK